MLRKMLKGIVIVGLATVLAVSSGVIAPIETQAHVIDLVARSRPIIINGIVGRVAAIPEHGDTIVIAGLDIPRPYNATWANRARFIERFGQEYSFTINGVSVSAYEFYEAIMQGREGELRMDSLPQQPQEIHPSQLPNWYPEAIEWMLSDEYVYIARQEIARRINEHRVAHGLRPLEINLALQDYADIRAAEIRNQAALRIRLSHTRPDGSAAGSGWYNSQNYINTRFAENITGGGILPSDPIELGRSIDTWKNSYGHNRHMLYDFDPHITMAIGIAPALTLVMHGEVGRFEVTSGIVFATGYGEGRYESWRN